MKQLAVFVFCVALDMCITTSEVYPSHNNEVERSVRLDGGNGGLSRQLIEALQAGNPGNVALHLQLVIGARTSYQASFELVSSRNGHGDVVLFGLVVHPQLHRFDVKYVQSRRERYQTFYYDLEPDVVNWLTLVFADRALWVYVNCSRIYERQIGPVDVGIAGHNSYNVEFTSRPLGSARLVDSKLLFNFEDRKWRQQCYQSLQPEISQSCQPHGAAATRELQSRVVSCLHNLSMARRDRSALTTALRRWQGCECHRPCFLSRNRKQSEGSRWMDGEEECTCSNGQVQCRCVREPTCWNTQTLHAVDGQSCRKCFYSCRDSDGPRTFHGSWATRTSTKMRCLCQDGDWTSCRNPVTVNGPVCNKCIQVSSCYQNGYYNCRCQWQLSGNVDCIRSCPGGYLLSPTKNECDRARKVQFLYDNPSNYLGMLDKSLSKAREYIE